MAVAFDAASSGSANASSLTFSHTCSGTERLLVVITSERYNSKVTGVTYAGAPLTNYGSDVNVNICQCTFWYLLNPNTGANNIVVSQIETERLTAGGMSFTGVSQSTPLGTIVTSDGSGTSASLSVASSSVEIVVDGLCFYSDDPDVTATVGVGQTERWAREAQSGVIAVRGHGSTEAGAATTTMSWTLTGSRSWTMVAAGVKPATTDPAPALATVSASALSGGAAIDLNITMPSDSDLSHYEIRRLTTGYPAINRSDGTVVSASATTTPSAVVGYSDAGLTNGTRYYYRVFNRDTAGTWNDGRTATGVAATIPAFLQRYKSDGTTTVAASETSGPNPVLEWQLATTDFESGKVGNFRLRTGDNAVTPPTGNTVDYINTGGGNVFRYEDPAASGTFVAVAASGVSVTYWGRKLRAYSNETKQRSFSLRIEQPAT